MRYFDFNPFGTQAIIVKFDCDQCGNNVESEEIGVPSPNYMADNSGDSQTDNEGGAVCENCGKEFEIEVYVTYAGASGNILDLPDGHQIEVEEIEEPYYEDEYDAISANTQFYQTFIRELTNINNLIDIEPNEAELKKVFHRHLYSGIIGVMETYLSDAFINTVLANQENLKRFFKTFKGFDKQNIAISAIYEFQERAEIVAKKTMLDVIYHNLPKVSNMYRDALEVRFPDFREIYKAVLTRHDLVHRNGKTKEGEEVVIGAEEVTQLIQIVREFITNIDEQINPIE